jgi:MFS transporter, DHA1 family, tetracycline resistance protein
MASAAVTTTAGKGQISTLCLIVFISLVGFGIVLPAFPFFGTMVGASPAQTTLAMGAYSLGQFIGAPVWGKLSDRYGRKPILISSLIGAIISYIIMGLSRDIVTLSIARLLGGLMAGNIAAAFAYVGDVTDPASRPKAMGMIGAAFGLGFIFGPAIGGLLAGNHPDQSDFAIIGYASAAFAALAAVAAALFLPESLAPERRNAAVEQGSRPNARAVLAAKPVIYALMALVLLVIGSGALMETSFAFFTHDVLGWGPQQVGLSFGAVGLISVALQAGGASPLSKRFGSGKLVIGGMFLYALGLIGLTQAESGPAVFAAMAVLSVGLGLFNPAYQTLASAQGDDSDRGLVMGLTQGASSLGRVVGPSASGLIYQSMGPTAPFATGAGVMILAIAVGLFATKAAHSATMTKGETR